jgi:hypothetical protein
MEFDQKECARLSAALVKAIAEANMLADTGKIGSEIRSVVRDARDLHGLLLEQLIAANPTPATICAAFAPQRETNSTN